MMATLQGLKVITLNVNCIRLTSKRRALFKKNFNSDADFIFLQETHSQLSDERIWLSEWGGTGIFSHERTNFHRVFILSIKQTVIDSDGRFIILQLQDDKESITLLNVYTLTQSEPRDQLNYVATLKKTDGIENTKPGGWRRF